MPRITHALCCSESGLTLTLTLTLALTLPLTLPLPLPLPLTPDHPRALLLGEGVALPPHHVERRADAAKLHDDPERGAHLVLADEGIAVRDDVVARALRGRYTEISRLMSSLHLAISEASAGSSRALSVKRVYEHPRSKPPYIALYLPVSPHTSRMILISRLMSSAVSLCRGITCLG